MGKVLGMTGAATSLLPFVPDKKVYDGLNLAKLVSVEVDTTDVKEESNWDMMKGRTVPRITFHFESVKDVHTHHYFHNYTVITNEEKEDKIAEAMFKSIYHMLEAYGVPSASIDKLMKGAISYEERTADALIETYTAFFVKVATMFNGTEDGKMPNIYKDKTVWIKLIRDSRNNGRLSFPFYPGTGFIELYKTGQKPAIRIDVTKETIEEKPALNPTTGAPIAGAGAGQIPEALQ